MSDEIGGCTTEELAHTSEIGLRAQARSVASLFACLARAMVALTGATAGEENGAENGGAENGREENAASESAGEEAETVRLEVDVEAVDIESLLVDWLNEVLYLHEVTGVVPEEIDVHAITASSIRSTVRGRRSQRMSELQIKAVTYHQLSIVQEESFWKAEVFFDI